MAILEKLVHIVFLGIYVIVSIKFILNAEKNTKSSDPRVKLSGDLTFRYLTVWTYGLQLLYYICVVFAHILNIIPFLQKTSGKLRSLADVLFTTIVLPYGLVVTVSFWSLYIIDRELVYPSWLDQVIPLWMNHALHTFNSVLPIIDMALCYHEFSSWLLTAKCILLYSFAYSICFFGTYYTHGKWLYPMFETMSYQETGFYSLGNILITFLFHAIVRFTCKKLIWAKSQTTEKSKSKKIKHKTKKVA